MRRVIIVGAGIAGLEAALTLREAGEELRVTLVSRDPRLRVRANELGTALGLGGAIAYGLRRLALRAGAGLVVDEVATVDTARGTVVTTSGLELGGDALLLTPGAGRVPVFEHGQCLDGDMQPSLVEDLVDCTVERVAVVIPRETRWTLPAYEAALMCAAFAPDAAVTVLTHERFPLELFGPTAGDVVAGVLLDAGVDWGRAEDIRVLGETSVLADGRWGRYDRVLHLPGLAGPALRGVPSSTSGFIRVDDMGRVPGCDGQVWAAGDGTTRGFGHGGTAARQAAGCAAEIAASAGLVVPDPLQPSLVRGMLRTAQGPLFLESSLLDCERASRASWQPLWHPVGKVDAPRLMRLLDDIDEGPWSTECGAVGRSAAAA